MTTMPQNDNLLKHLFELIEKNRPVFKQKRSYNRAVALLLAELFVFARHTITQLLMVLGMVDQDWSAWYRLFSCGRFNYEKASEILFEETLTHVGENELYVVGGDATQTPRSSCKMEGAGWLRNMRTPPFMVGIHAAQRWFNGSWLIPDEQGYSRALPIRWLPCFTEKSEPETVAPRKEWQAALAFAKWILEQLARNGRDGQPVLMVGDGSYDNLELWKGLPDGVNLLARSAKNQVLYSLPAADAHKNRKYGERVASPQQRWGKGQHKGWHKSEIRVRGKLRHLQYKISEPVLRKGAPHRPLFLILVRGKKGKNKYGKTYTRQPLPFLVNAVQNEQGAWVLPLPIETLLFWAWQRWELEVCHHELKSNFGLGNKQCFNPTAAILSVQWSVWVYALLLLAGYRTWGLCRAPDVPTRWWRGSTRWSLNTLWRAYRAAFWGQHDFHPLVTPTLRDWGEKEVLIAGLRNAIFASARA